MKNEPTYNDYLILAVKFLSGEASQEENNALETWIQETASNKEAFENLNKIWEETKSLNKEDLINLDLEWKFLEERISEEKKKIIQPAFEQPVRSFGFYFTRIAAGLIILVVTTFGALFVSKNIGFKEILAETERKEIKLPDGSEVTLNIASGIKFPKKFNRNYRDVELNGEAFFAVRSDSLKPFRIEGGNVLIEVLGTSFNVDAYDDKDQVEVVVESGIVSVSILGDEASGFLLEAGEKAAMIRSQNTLIKEENEDINFIAWKTRKIYFENDPLQEVIDVLNDVYHSKISVQESSLLDYTLTATFNNQSLDAVLNVIQNTLELEIIKEGDMIRIRGDGH